MLQRLELYENDKIFIKKKPIAIAIVMGFFTAFAFIKSCFFYKSLLNLQSVALELLYYLSHQTGVIIDLKFAL